MRFLFSILSITWLLFGWVSFEAMRWRPPSPPPFHAEQALHSITHEELESQKKYWQTLLNEYQLSNMDRESVHFQLATLYWIETYMMRSRPQQLQMLQKSLNHCFQALELSTQGPNHSNYLYSIADLYHQMHEYKQAENYYIRALSQNPNHKLARIRYYDLKKEMAR